MQLKMDPSSDQLASAVSGALPTLVMSGSAPDSPTTITIVSPAGADVSGGNPTDTGNTPTPPGTSSANPDTAGNTNGNSTSGQNRANGSLKTTTTATPTTGQQPQTTQQSSHSTASQNLPQAQFVSNPRFNQANIVSPTASMPLRILVLKDLVGAIIGRGGGTIKTITQDTHAKVDVHRKEHSTANENVIMIYGTPEACTSACKRIVQVMQDESRALNRPDEVVLKILAPNTVIGRIIGKNGATIKRIMTNTEAKISVNSANLVSQYSNERTILISGSLEAMTQAESAISAKLRQCYETDFYTHLQASMASTYPMSMAPQGLLNVPTPPTGPHPGATTGPAFFMSPHPAAAAVAAASASRLVTGAPHSTVPGSGPAASGSVTASQSVVPGSVLGPSVAAAVAAATAAQAGPSTSVGPQFGAYYPPFAVHQTAQGFFPSSYPSSAAAAVHGFYGFGLPPPPGTHSMHSGQSVIVPGGHVVGQTTGVQHQQQENVREIVSLFIPNSVVGAIIGRGGQTIREMITQSNANIKVAPITDDDSSPLSSLSSPSPTSPDSASAESRQIERRVVIVGTPSAQYYAQNMIFYHVVCELFQQQQQPHSHSGSKTSQNGSQQQFNGFYGDKSFLRVEIYVPNSAVRRIIGRGGSVITELQRSTGTTIKLAKERDSSASQSSIGTSSEHVTSTSTTASIAGTEDSTPVHIIGDFMSCYMAQRHIRNIVAQASLSGPVTYSQPQQSSTSTGRQQQPHDTSASSNIKTAKQSESSSDNKSKQTEQ